MERWWLNVSVFQIQEHSVRYDRQFKLYVSTAVKEYNSWLTGGNVLI